MSETNQFAPLRSRQSAPLFSGARFMVERQCEGARRSDLPGRFRLDINNHGVAGAQACCRSKAPGEIQDMPGRPDRHQGCVEVRSLKAPGDPDAAPVRKGHQLNPCRIRDVETMIAPSHTHYAAEADHAAIISPRQQPCKDRGTS